MAHPRNTAQHFWNQVNIRSDNECWNWTGRTDKDGYGIGRMFVRTIQSHRIAWILTNGEIPSGMLICHSCDNPRCCNPNHLFVGSALDNNHDRQMKGRNAPLEKIFAHLHPETYRGESNGNAKLTKDQVDEMRNLHADGKSIGAVSRLFGISETQARRIIHREHWRTK